MAYPRRSVDTFSSREEGALAGGGGGGRKFNLDLKWLAWSKRKKSTIYNVALSDSSSSDRDWTTDQVIAIGQQLTAAVEHPRPLPAAAVTLAHWFWGTRYTSKRQTSLFYR